MTIWSIPLRGIRGKVPTFELLEMLYPNSERSENWKKSWIHDTRPIIDGVCEPIIQIPNTQGISINHYEYSGEDIAAKFSGEYDFVHLMPHLPTIYSEIVIDDSYWKDPYMPNYPNHNDSEKYSTINSESGSLITALYLIGFNRFIAPCILKNSTLKNAHNCKDGSIEFMLNHPFQLPMALFPEGVSKSRITQKDLEWIGRAMRTMNRLFYEDENDYTTTVTAMSYYYGDFPPRAKMTLIWSAIEDLLRPKDSESIRFGIRSRSAMILGKNDNDEIKRVFDEVAKLYDKRNSAAHGRRFTWSKGLEHFPTSLREDMHALIDSYQLLCDLFYRIVDRGNRFSDDELYRLEEQYKQKFPL